MDHFPSIIQHLSPHVSGFGMKTLNLPLHLLSLRHPSFGSRHRRWTISSHWEPSSSHCGSVKRGSYLSSLNVSKRMGNQWCIPVRKNFSLNLISPPLYLFVDPLLSPPHHSCLAFLACRSLLSGEGDDRGYVWHCGGGQKLLPSETVADLCRGPWREAVQII